MKLKLIALAVMLAAGSAHAAIDTGLASGNGSLLLNLKWKDGTTTDVNGNTSASAAFDLGITMNDAMAWNGVAGFKSTWNLGSGVMTTWLNNVMTLSTTIGSYGSAYNSFLGTTDLVLGNAEMNVFALDGTGTNPGDTRILSTTSGISTTGTALSLASGSIPSNANFNNIFGNVTVTNFLVAVNNAANHNSAANGASNATAASGNAWFDNGTAGMDKFGNLSAFDSTNKFAGSYAAGSGILSGQAKALPFYMVVGSSTSPTDKANMTPFGYDLDRDGVIEFDNNATVAGGSNEYGLWTLQGNTLTFANPVPEAETYAMMLAGLGLVGFMVRRRRNAI